MKDTKDLTRGPIRGHLIAMALPMAVGMGVQMLYYLIDLYFVARLGHDALAGVGAAGNAALIILGLTQILSVGTVALTSHAVGRQDDAAASDVFHQSLLIGCGAALLTLLAGYAIAADYMRQLSANASIAGLGVTYLYWYLPGMALQFVLTALGSSLRGAGLAQPAMMVQLLTVVINIVLAPVLIAGWGTGHPMGVAGAALASTVSVTAGALLLLRYCMRHQSFMRIDLARLRPRLATWGSILKIGLPAGGEYLLMFAFSAFVYLMLRDFGAAAQAGFGIGTRVLQVVFLPAAALGFAVPAVAGQNYGAGLGQRVRETLRTALLMEAFIMVVLTIACQASPGTLLGMFSSDPHVLAFGTTFLTYTSWNFLASGIVFACSGLFQAMGNTWPALLCAAMRVLTFMLPLAWLSRQSGFEVTTIWKLSVATVALQACLALLLVHWQMKKRLPATDEARAPLGAAGA